MRPTTPDIIAAIVCTIFLFILVGAAFLEWVSRRITAAINARTPDVGLDILPVFDPVDDIRAELARTTDPDVRDVLLDQLIEATRERAA